MIEVRTWDKNFLLVHMAHISLISSLVVGMGWETIFYLGYATDCLDCGFDLMC